MESMCTAVYISLNECSYAGGKCLFKLFSSWETDHIPGGPVVKIPQKLHVVAFFSLGILMSCFFSLRILSWDIKFLQNYDPYTPWYHNVIYIFHHSGLFFVLYLLVNTVIVIAIARKAVECIPIIIFLLLEKTRVIFQGSMTLIKNNIIWKYLAKKC